MLDEIKIIISILLGAVASGIPLYFKMRSMSLQLKAQSHKQDLKNTSENQKLEATTKINHEAEWKRIIEFRDEEMSRLRERDNQQEVRINDLFNKYVDTQRAEARCSEKVLAQNETIKDLLSKVAKLEEVLIQRGAAS